MPPPPTVAPAQIDPWKEAASIVEEDRGEATGNKAQVDTPPQLKHYQDRRRFLAIQVAEINELDLKLPHDYAELVGLIRENELVELEPVGEDYILYGVGANATDEPFSHFDQSTGDNVQLFKSINEFEQEEENLSKTLKGPQARLASLENELKKLGKRDRKRRSALQSDIGEIRTSIHPDLDRKKLLESFYKGPRRDTLFAEYKTLEELAADFGGKTYDLTDPSARQKLKVRLLSFIRPEARDVLFEIAHAYKKQFDRPLPVTSLVRPEQYQIKLSQTNPNATRIDAPPHSTGLAFDIFYYYMTAAEQQFLMSLIAALEDEGRVEALRETRNHIHVFSFADGKRPDERLIAGAIGETSATKPAKPKSGKNGQIARSTRGKNKSKAITAKRGRPSKGKTVASARKGRR